MDDLRDRRFAAARSRRGRTVALVLLGQAAVLLAALASTVALSGPYDVVTVAGIVLAIVVFALLARRLRSRSAEVRVAYVPSVQRYDRDR